MNESIKKMYEQEPKDLVRKDHCGFDCCSAYLHGHSLRSSLPDQTEAAFPLQERSSVVFSIQTPDYCLTFLHPEWHICYWKPCVSHS